MALTKLNTRSGIDLSSYATSTDLNNLTTGKVLQVQSSTSNGTTQGTSTSFSLITGMLVNITPSSASSKIFVNVDVATDSGSSNGCFITIYRNGSDLGGSEGFGGTEGPNRSLSGMSILDSPNTTSQVTYEARYRSRNGGLVECPPWGSGRQTITVMEIAG